MFMGSDSVPLPIRLRNHLNSLGFKFEDDGKPSAAVNKKPVPAYPMEVSVSECDPMLVTYKQKIPDNIS